MANPSEPLMFHLFDHGHYGHRDAVIDDQQIDLSANRFDGGTGFVVALQKGLSEAVKAFVKMVLARSDLSDKQKEELFAGKNADTMPQTFIAFQKGNSETVKAFLEEVLASGLPDKIKERLLAAKGKKSTRGIFMTIKEGHSETLKVFRECVSASQLSEEIKNRLVPLTLWRK